jgi:hypothetical protein
LTVQAEFSLDREEDIFQPLFRQKTLIVIPTAVLLLRTLSAQPQGAQALTPKEYSEQHIIASNPKDPHWADDVSRLAKLGDGFTVQHLDALDTHKLTPGQADLLKTALVALRARGADEDAPSFINSIQLRLERAAWADLSSERSTINTRS